MTMSDIRMQEAWAMAHWLSRANPLAYGIEDDAKHGYDLIVWPDNAITRVDIGAELSQQAVRLYENVSGDSILGFLTETDGRLKFHEQPVAFLPFSSYDLGTREPQALAIQYSSPDRENHQPQHIDGLAPRGLRLLSHAVRSPQQHFQLTSVNALIAAPTYLTGAPVFGRVLRTQIPPEDCRLNATA